MFQKNTLPEETIYTILSNDRRRAAFRQLSLAGDEISLRDLSVRIATAETGQSPPPRGIRESVYSSLHQTHLPMLDELSVVEYNREARTVRLCENANEVTRSMEVLTRKGLTWGELYRSLGIFSLLVILGSLLDAPLFGTVDTLLLTSGFLFVFAVMICSQLWTNRRYVIHAFQK